MYRLELQGRNEKHEEFYANCFMAISLTQKQISVAEWDDVIGLVRKLKAIGEDTKEKLAGHTVYKLCDEGGMLLLERAEMNLMKDFIKQPIWRPSALETIKETLEWLDSAPKDVPLTVDK